MTDEAKTFEKRIESGELSIVHRLTDRFEGDLLSDALRTEEIPQEARIYADLDHSLPFEEMHHGIGIVVVRSADAERARAFITEFLAHDAEAAAQALEDAESSIADEEAPVLS
ncbi:MAG: hypothetical protein GY898_14525 [Proteobacteria bacterium]|nr:hypothetical protein [Pseudomonadota bacterium]